MIIKTIKAKEIPSANIRTNSRLKKCIVKDTVESFKRSSARNIEVIDDEGLWTNSNNFRRSFQAYLNAHDITSMYVTIRGNRVFLIKSRLQ
jgi:hypothetical protein